MIAELYLDQSLDEQGWVEEFTRDAYLTLPRGATDHLDEDGLPLAGIDVFPGMLLIAKFGTTKSYLRENLPNDLERFGEDETTLLEKYRHMFYDASFYVPDGIHGKVAEAFLEPCGKFKRAIVRVKMRDPETGN